MHHEGKNCEIILNLGQWFRRCRFKDFLSEALAVLLLGGAEPFMQFWNRALWRTFMWSYVKFGQVVQQETFRIWSSGGPFIQRTRPTCAILVEYITRNDSVKLFWIWTSGSWGNAVNRYFFYLELWQPFCWAECNHLCNMSRGYYEEPFCEVIWNLDQWFMRCCLKTFLI